MLQQIQAKVAECRAIAEKHYGHEFPKLTVRVNLTGLAAGQAVYDPKFQKYTLRFNSKLAKENEDQFLKQTVPHEFAHFIQYCLFPGSQAHGKEWKSIMVEVFNLPPKRCHKYDTSSVRKKTKPYIYACVTCSHEYQFGAKRHSNMLKNPKHYRCGKCAGLLERAKTLKPKSRNLDKRKMKPTDLD